MPASDERHLDRLVGVALAARDAFISASRNVETPYLARLFRERAEDQARIAAHLAEQRHDANQCTWAPFDEIVVGTR